MTTLKTEQNAYYALRVASAMCFIGHGAFGIITKPIWCNYFAVFGIGHDTAYHLMPILGTVDILMGLIILFYPVRIIVGWLVVWGLVTAALRPLSGEPFAEMIERAGNYGAPLILLILCGTGTGIASWFRKLDEPGHERAKRLGTARKELQVVVFLLLTGHAWLNLLGKKSLLSQYASLGFHDPHQVAMIAGYIEIVMALIILIKPVRPLLLVILAWKMGTELFYPHWEVFEWVERGGSYGTLLALWFTLKPDGLTEKIRGGVSPKLSTRILFSIMGIGITFIGAYYFVRNYTTRQGIDQHTLNEVTVLDQQNHDATFVFVNPGFANQVSHNKVILLEPIGDDLRINFDNYLHKGHSGPLYIVLPDKYGGPKEKMILKSFPDYKGWYGSMLSNDYVMYAAK